ncbi:hypothetical protein TrLO_g10041 [Triparma laevis f. longispina]|uniref:Uncharacterized protein n=1 Tax=Triparma laevis f. longispina TaxID=1714387 RepID=A0A9W7DWW6_9STRA|nr:hypothetical protein TrLO_g10041 [Triparma laevis f. longispina]
MTMKLSNLKSSIHYATLQRIAEISFAFGAVIQALAFVSGYQSTIAIVSLTSGIITAATNLASMSIELDCNAESRAQTGEFYGFKPLQSMPRTILVCILHVVMSSSHLALALANVESSATIVIYLCAEFF